DDRQTVPAQLHRKPMSSKASRESTGFTESALFLGSNRDVCIRQGAPGGERPPYGTQGASLGAWPAALRAGPTGASQAPDDSRRSATPSLGCVKRQSKTRAQKTRRGNEEVLLGARAFSSSFRPSRDSGEGRNP